MKIGFDAKRLYHNRSGLGNYSRYVVSQLGQRLPHSDLNLYAKAPSQLWDGPGEFQEIGGFSSIRRFLSLNSYWEKDQLDIYHGLSNELPYYASSSKVKKVVTIHDLLYLDFPEDFPWIDRKIYDLKFRRACEIADKIVAISQATKVDLIDRFRVDEEKIEVIYQHCDPKFFIQPSEESIIQLKKKLQLNRPYFICVGSFSHRKNQQNLIRAFADGQSRNEYDLIFVGGKNLAAEKCKELADQLGILENVHFFHTVDHQDLVRLLYGSFSVIYPSIKEGFGLPVIEGLAAEKSVITSIHTSCHEAGGESVFAVDVLSISELTSAMDKIISDVNFRLKLEKSARDRALIFHPNKEMPKLINLYQNLIG